MTHEFYLNNELLDVDDNMSFNIQYKSSLFGDLSKISTHGSSGLKFPLTANNRRIIKNLNLHDVVTGFPYQTHVMDYYRNGINIVLDGIFRIESIEERHFTGQFAFGIRNLTKDLKERKLKELPMMWVDYTENGLNDIFNNGLKNYGFLRADWGVGVGNDVKEQLPSVSVNYLLSQIENQTEITLENLPRDEKLYLTTVDRQTTGANWGQNTLNFLLMLHQYTNNYTTVRANIFGEKDQWGEIILGGTTNEINIKGDGTISYDENLRLYLMDGIDPDNIAGELFMILNGEEIGKSIANIYHNILGYYLSFVLNVENIEVKAGDKIWFESRVYFKDGTGNGTRFNNATYKEDFSLSIISRKYDNLMFPLSGYPINANLPDMTWQELVQTIAWINGLFPYYDYNNPRTLSFFGVDDVLQNMENGNCYDWTEKRKTLRMKHEYTYGDYAQQNKLDYKKDDTITVDTAGYIHVNNSNLDETKDLLELKVAASDMQMEHALIRAFTQEDEKITFKKPSPRIIKAYETGNHKWIGVFREDMYFRSANEYMPGIIDRKYIHYQGVIKTPIVVEAEYLLTEVDLIDFDIRKPIWDNTLGRVYAVIDLTMQKNNVAKVKMIDVSLIPMTE